MSKEKWIDWHPKVGDARPDKYRWKGKQHTDWTEGDGKGTPIDDFDLRWNNYQILAPAESQEDRPPWIDPQCKFRWGDRVKDRTGLVLFVINPDDRSDPRRGAQNLTVLVGTSSNLAPPYATRGQLIANGNWEQMPLGLMRPEDLELFPEELPPHFDPDQVKPVVSVPARKPREIWLNEFEEGLWYYVFLSEESARQMPGVPKATQVLFREVLPEEHNPLTNMQYSPGG